MSDAYSQAQQSANRQGHWQRQAVMVRSRADEHVPFPPAGSDAVERRDARGLRRCRDPAKHAGFRGGAGARRGRARGDSGKRGRPDHEGLPGRIIRPRRAGRGRDEVRQPRDPAGQGADGQRRQGGCRGGALRPLGRDQPGRHRYRRHARPARRHRRAARRHQPRHRGLCRTGASTPPYRGGRPHLAAACAADAVRAEARRICRGAAPLEAAAAAPAPRDAGAAIRRRGRHARRPRRQGIAGRGKTGRRNSSCRCPTRPGTPTATASRRRPRCSPFSPAPAARSRATFR